MMSRRPLQRQLEIALAIRDAHVQNFDEVNHWIHWMAADIGITLADIGCS